MLSDEDLTLLRRWEQGSLPETAAAEFIAGSPALTATAATAQANGSIAADTEAQGIDSIQLTALLSGATPGFGHLSCGERRCWELVLQLVGENVEGGHASNYGVSRTWRGCSGSAVTRPR